MLGIAFLTQWHVLIDHDYLLRSSHLPRLVALFVFLLCWQVMTMAMMLPSSLSRLLTLCHTILAFFLQCARRSGDEVSTT